MSGTFNRANVLRGPSRPRIYAKRAAKAAGVTQGLISQLESGLTVDPSGETLHDLASALRVPIAFLLSSERPHGMPQFHYRKRAKLGRRALEMIEAQINIRRIHAARLLQGYDIEADRFPLDRFGSIGVDTAASGTAHPRALDAAARAG